MRTENAWREVCEVIGVEPMEPFKVKPEKMWYEVYKGKFVDSDLNKNYRISEMGLDYYDYDSTSWKEAKPLFLSALIFGGLNVDSTAVKISLPKTQRI